MKILNLNLEEAVVELIPESIDDLWHVMNILRPGDLVEARTIRTLKIRGSMGEVEGKTRVSLKLKLKIEAVQLNIYGKCLKIYGSIESSEKIEGLKGRHHSIHLKVGERIRVFKDKWLPNELKRLNRAKASSGGRCLIVVAIDRDDCCIAAVREYGLDVKAEIPVRLPGKRENEKRESSLRELFKKISETLERLEFNESCLLLVVGPGFLYEKLANHLNSKAHYRNKVRTGKTSIGGLSGIYEALRSGLVAKYLGEAKVVYEAKLLDEALETMAKNPDTVTYGVKSVEDLAPTGAVKTLLISEKLLRNMSSEELDKLLEAIREVERKEGEVVFISSGFENLDRISGFGGVIAILRYPVTWRGAAASP